MQTQKEKNLNFWMKFWNQVFLQNLTNLESYLFKEK